MSQPTTNESFSVGEVAIFVRPGSKFYGVEVVVTHALHTAQVVDWEDGKRKTKRVYGIYGPFGGNRYGSAGYATEPCNLRKKRPPLANWQDCAWRPSEVTV